MLFSLLRVGLGFDGVVLLFLREDGERSRSRLLLVADCREALTERPLLRGSKFNLVCCFMLGTAADSGAEGVEVGLRE